MDGGNNSYRRNFLIQRSGGRAEGKLDFANFETEPSDRRTHRPTDRPTDEKGAFRDSDDACEGEIRGHGGEDESLAERESERGLS